MKPVSAESDGIKISILNILPNKRYTCKADCWNAENCSIKKKCSISQSKSVLCGTEVTINVLNASNSPVSLRPGAWEMIDSNGYSYGACALCETHMPSRMVNPESWSVSPSTQVKTVLLFPELEDGIFVSVFLYVCHAFSLKFEIKPLTEDIKSLFAIKEEMKIKQALEHDYELRTLQSEVDTLKRNIFARFNNTLTPKEKSSIENNIINTEFTINEKFRRIEQWKKELFEDDFNKAITQFHSKIEAVHESEKKDKLLIKKVDSLYELTPREFEEWTASLFESLGYDKVTLTPQSNDKGIDVLAKKSGLTVAVQCKKYKGVVGSPEIQAFLGAMQNAEADKGFFITTGTFSIEAEKMALNMPIELYDKIGLIQLIDEAMNR
jgi:restriction system protein